MDTVCSLMQLVALVFEIIGVFYMANAYLIIEDESIIKMLWTAFFHGDLKRFGMHPAFCHSEDAEKVIRGLSFIGIGFLISAFAITINLLSTHWITILSNIPKVIICGHQLN